MDITTLTLSNAESLESDKLNLELSFDTGKNYFEGGINLDVVFSTEFMPRYEYSSFSKDHWITHVESFKINFVEDENENLVAFKYEERALSDKIEQLLNDHEDMIAKLY